jgi:uncharacterized protein (DUF2236 family)
MLQNQAMAEPEPSVHAASPGEVTRDDFEEQIARLRASVADPAAGLFGPRSISWEINKEASCFLGSHRAALLQLAHPYVAWAIQQHSRTREAPFARFQRTFFHIYRMLFSDLPTVIRAARAVRAIHTRITGEIEAAAGPLPAGSAYRANDAAALCWVHATLIDTAVLCYEAIVRELPFAEKDAYYQETKRFAQLFGLGEEGLPRDWAGFQAYMTGMLEGEALVVTEPARSMSRFLFGPLLPGTGGLMRRYEELTAWLLPERLALDFGLDRGGEAGRRRYEAAVRRIRRVWPHLPKRIRYVPPYVQAERRVSGRMGYDPVGELLMRIWLGQRAAI